MTQSKRVIAKFREKTMTIDIGYHKWTCDDCGEQVYDKAMPKGWIYLDKKFGVRDKIEHRCEKCKEKK